MNESHTPQARFRVADLPQNSSTPFDLRPDQAACESLRNQLGLSALRKLSFAGKIAGIGKSDWELTGMLGATVVQPCVVTLEPVTTRIDVKVQRRFLAHMDLPESGDDGEEIEMPEDENAEALGNHIDAEQVMIEALALNLPLYPRKNDASLDESVFTEPGKTPMKDEDARPFAGLASLRDKLSGDDKK